MSPFPKFADNDELMVALLEQIAANTGGMGEMPATHEVEVDATGVGSRVGTIDPTTLTVVETDNLDASEPDGTMEVQPGETETFLRFKGTDHALLAVGGSDHQDATYRLEADGQHPVGGTTNSPLGAINDPFSFVNQLGGAPQAGRTVYKVHLDATASAPINVAGRMFLEIQP